MNSNNEQEKKINIIIVGLAIVLVGLLALSTWLAKEYNNKNNAVTIYYKGFENPRIRYRYDKAAWGKMAGEPMEANNEQKGYTHKIVIPLKKYDYIIALFNDSGENIDDNNGEYYKFEKGEYLFDNGTILNMNGKSAFQIVKFTSSVKNGFTGQKVKFSVGSINGKGPFLYKFSVMNSAGVETVIQEFVEGKNTAEWTPLEAGEYTVVATAKDAEGTVSTKKINKFVVTSLGISEIKTNVQSPQEVGTNISLSMDIENSANLDLTCYYEISNGNDTKRIEATSMGAADWSPTEEGKYNIVGYIENGELKISKSIEFEIEEEELPMLKLVVYYKGIENPKMYYKDLIQGGDFQSVEMTRDSSQPGYDYKVEMDIVYAGQYGVYFSDGISQFDNNYGMNFSMGPGTYGVMNGQMVTLSGGDEEYWEEDDDDEDDNDNNGNNGNGNNWYEDFNNGNDNGITWPFN